MKAKSAKNKGSRFENYLVERFREDLDANTHRTPGSGAGLDKNDIRIPSLNIEVEAKHQSQFKIGPDWEQAKRQTTTGNKTVLAVRHPKQPEFKETLIVVDFEDFLEILQGYAGEVEVRQKLDPKDKWVLQDGVRALKKIIKIYDEKEVF